MRTSIGVLGIACALAMALCGCGMEACEGGILPDSESHIADAVGYFPWDVRVDADGGFIIAGFTTAWGATLPPLDMALIKLDATGSVRWTREIDAGQYEEARGVLPTSDGGYIVVGYTGFPVYDLGLTQNEAQLLLLKLDSSGEEIWSQKIRLDTFTVGYSVCESADGAFVIAASAGETVPGDAEEGATAIALGSDGKYLLAGYTQSGLQSMRVVATLAGSEGTAEAP